MQIHNCCQSCRWHIRLTDRSHSGARLTPNDLFFRSHWEDIDGIDSGLIDIKCEIASLIGNDLVDHLQ